MDFDNWLIETTNLSQSTIYKYTHAVNTISDEMLSCGVIDKPIPEMELFELDLSIAIIFHNQRFIVKNTTGNNMYSNALKWYRSFAQSNIIESHTIIEEERHIEQDSDLTITEKQAIIKARIGQGVYREKLLKKYGKCIITDIDIKQVLVASHIKPWAVCNNYDRVNTNNGLILSATYDKLFDGGLISFTPTGKLLISRHINDKNRTILHLNINKVFDLKYTAEMKDFLLYHNDVVFVR